MYDLSEELLNVDLTILQNWITIRSDMYEYGGIKVNGAEIIATQVLKWVQLQVMKEEISDLV